MSKYIIFYIGRYATGNVDGYARRLNIDTIRSWEKRIENKFDLKNVVITNVIKLGGKS